MSEKEKPSRPRRAARRPMLRFGIWLASAALGLGVLAGAIVAVFSDQTVPAPAWVTDRLEASLNEGIGTGRVGLSGIDITFRKGAAPVVSVIGVRVFDDEDRFLAWVPRAQVSLDRSAMLGGRISPQSVQIEGLRMSLRRGPDGALDVALGEGEGTTRIGGSPAELLDGLNAIFDADGFEALQLIEASDVRLVMDDQLSGRRWDVSEGALVLERTALGAEFRLGFDTVGHDEAPARIALSASAEADSLSASLGASVENVSVGDIAAWGPSLEWMRLLDAPVSGSLRLEFSEVGEVAALNAALDIGRGFARVQGTERAVAVDQARVYFGYDPATARIDFDQISLTTSEVAVAAEGQMLVRDGGAGEGAQWITQLSVSEFTLSPRSGTLAEPVRFSGGGVDLRLRFDPFRLDIGQIALTDGDLRLLAHGSATVKDGDFRGAVDIEANRTDHQRFLSLWPLEAAPQTREWLVENIWGGTIHDVTAAIRLYGQDRPVVAVGFQFEDATLRYLPFQPPLVGLSGYGTLEGDRLSIMADRAGVIAPTGGAVDASGTVFAVPDINRRPGIGEIGIRTTGPLTAQLSLLDLRPFEFLSRAGQPVELAEGTATVHAQISVPLIEEPADEDIQYDVTGVLSDVRSDVLVPGHEIRADRLAITATASEGLRISGRARLSGVPFEGDWLLPLAPGSDGGSRLAAAVTVSQAASDALSLGLPGGTIRGAGLGRVEVTFPVGDAPRLTFFSDLNNLRLSLPQRGWFKGANRTGALEARARLEDPLAVESLLLDAPGLSAEGRISLDEAGNLDRAVFDRVNIGGWFTGPVELIGRGPDRPFDIVVNGGRLDFRRSDFGTDTGGEAGALDVRLDRLVISDGISLTGLRGKFDPNRRMAGRFTARVNGKTPVTGVLTPSAHGAAVTINATDGGGVIRDAGILTNGRGGDLKLTLVPREADGFYDGTLEIGNMRVRDAPALAELLSALSVVGLLEQLGGGGLVFSEVSAEFVLTPDAIEVHSSRAVGASLGLTMDGSYDLASAQMDMQGVVTPIYMINGIGQLVSRRGEGLFGISYRMRGAVDDPKVTVNPLSLLTPGFLRDIFRKPGAKGGG